MFQLYFQNRGNGRMEMKERQTKLKERAFIKRRINLRSQSGQI